MSTIKSILKFLQWLIAPLKELNGRWSDIDDDGMTSRYGALFRDAKSCTLTKTAGRYTKIKIKGRWKCKYTGKILNYPDINVDHIVPKQYAKENKKGIWTEASFTEFANDMANLICVEDSINKSKQDKSIAEWMPEKSQEWYRKKWKEICEKWDIRHP